MSEHNEGEPKLSRASFLDQAASCEGSGSVCNREGIQIQAAPQRAGASPPYQPHGDDNFICNPRDPKKAIFCHLTDDRGKGDFAVQGASTCAYTIAPASQNIPAGGGTGTVNVTTTTACACWGVVKGYPSWITDIQINNVNGSGTVIYTVALNTGAARQATLTVAGKTFTVKQAGTP